MQTRFLIELKLFGLALVRSGTDVRRAVSAPGSHTHISVWWAGVHLLLAEWCILRHCNAKVHKTLTCWIQTKRNEIELNPAIVSITPPIPLTPFCVNLTPPKKGFISYLWFWQWPLTSVNYYSIHTFSVPILWPFLGLGSLQGLLQAMLVMIVVL